MDRKPDQLFERFRRTGDPAALAELFDRTSPEILRVALHLSGDPVEAEDLLQATFVTSIEAASRWDSRRRVVPWLLGILANHARRSRDRRRAASLPDADIADPAAPPGEEAEGAEIVDEVTRAIDGLPDPYRRALLLKVKHGMASVEIAHLLDVPPPLSPEAVGCPSAAGPWGRIFRSLSVLFGIRSSAICPSCPRSRGRRRWREEPSR